MELGLGGGGIVINRCRTTKCHHHNNCCYSLVEIIVKNFSLFFFGEGLSSPITKNSLATSHECQDHCAFHGTYALRASPLCHFWAPQNIGKWSFVF
jgi:hypothetical protein